MKNTHEENICLYPNKLDDFISEPDMSGSDMASTTPYRVPKDEKVMRAYDVIKQRHGLETDKAPAAIYTAYNTFLFYETLFRMNNVTMELFTDPIFDGSKHIFALKKEPKHGLFLIDDESSRTHYISFDLVDDYKSSTYQNDTRIYFSQDDRRIIKSLAKMTGYYNREGRMLRAITILIAGIIRLSEVENSQLKVMSLHGQKTAKACLSHNALYQYSTKHKNDRLNNNTNSALYANFGEHKEEA